jgi:hypothetical protein
MINWHADININITINYQIILKFWKGVLIIVIYILNKTTILCEFNSL